MPTPEQMEAAVHAYVAAFDAGDAEQAVAIFAPDAVIEDPIGTAPKVGEAAIREFYQASMATGAKLVLDGAIRIAAAHAAFPMRVMLQWDGQDTTIHVIDTFAFDENGKVKEMKAYFGPGNMIAG
ncbi:nuclear transport factor 2 family protein [Novosphingobium sp.]|uniref:nuclear transport factor 2 family protein n=1 Tax=Novosphingobium sp. TaxID=1874826 RepID=UPI0035B19B7E